MSKSEKLNNILNKKYLKHLIPFLNMIVTYIKKKRIIMLFYDSKKNLWFHKENKQTFIIDSAPYWNTTIESLKNNLKEICSLKYLPKTGDIVVDIGAGVGTEVIIFQKLVGNGCVYAIEAHPDTFSILKQLYDINKFTNVNIYNQAINNIKGEVKINNNVNHVGNSIFNASNDGLTVKAVTFDEFIKDNKINKIDFLKMNIEGAEELAIEGMENAIKIIENIAISCHDFLYDNSGSRIKNKIVAFLTKNNYTVEYANSEHIVRNSWVYGTKSNSITQI